MSLVIKHITHGSKDYLKEVALRQLVLREPLGLKFTTDQLEAESGEIHLGIFNNDEIIGCMLLAIPQNGVAKMRQVAVHPSYQNKGIGSQLVRYFEGFVVANKFDKIVLHARKEAVKFYQNLGYKTIGNEFVEVGIPHYEMLKELVY